MSAEDWTEGRIVPLPRRMTPAGQKMLERIEPAGDLRPVTDRDYVVKGWLDRDAVSVLYGDANAGKSFLAIDLAHHVSTGQDWGGNRVRQGAVLYIAAEGGQMFANRLVARGARFWVLRGPLTLAGRNPEAPSLAEAVRNIAETGGPFSLIVIDTMARVMGAADENAAADISVLMRSVDHIRDQTGAHVMLVHHTGKDAARGARGHSSLRAAVDTEIEVSKDSETGRRRARTTKQRDLPGGAEIEFDLDVIKVGTDSDGDQVTSCIIKHKEERLI